MSLLVEYSIVEGKAPEQANALRSLIASLGKLGDPGFDYTAFETDDPTRFIAVLEFEDDAAKQRFLDSEAFAIYREGTKGRFTGPPATTPLKLVASTRK